jgi:nickel-dependent lactate racemase
VGDDIMRNFSIVEHNCHKDNLYVGVTSRGTRVEIDRRVLDADRMLAIGGMMPHYFAVFGGGPKLLIPGCASQRCIEQNHKMSLHLEPEWHPGNGPGTLEDNDLIQDIIEGVGMLPKIYHIGIISDENEQPHRIFAGEIIFTYRKMSKLAVNLFGVKRRELAEVVIVSCGGHPKDMELLQAHKSMFHASASLREGGTMIVFAQCSMGIGSKDLEILMEIDDLSDIRQSLKRKYVNNGQALISLMMMGQKYNMKLKTELDDNILHKLNFDRIEENELEHLVEKSIIQGHRVYYFPSASNTIFSKT